jgi:microcystin-dependent protein
MGGRQGLRRRLDRDLQLKGRPNMKAVKTALLALAIALASVSPAPPASAGSPVSELGFIRLMAGFFAPSEYMYCKGDSIIREQHSELYSAIGTRFGGSNASIFNLPNLDGAALSDSPGIALQANAVVPMRILPAIRISGTDALRSYTGQVHLYAGIAMPEGATDRFIPCDGRQLAIADYQGLFNVIGTAFGGDGVTTFNLPDLRAAPSGLECTASGTPLGSSNLRFLIDADGDDPATVRPTDRYTSEIIMFAGAEGKVTDGFLPCDGRTLQIQDYQVLYSLLGVLYGGNGWQTFNLPDFRNNFPVASGGELPSGSSSCTRGPVPGFAGILFLINNAGEYPPRD